MLRLQGRYVVGETSYTRRYTWIHWGHNLSSCFGRDLENNISSTFLLVVTRWSSCQSLVVVNNKCQPVAVWPNFAQPIHWVKTKSKVPPMLTRHRLKEALVAAKTTSKSLLYHNDLRMWISWKQQIILWSHQHPLIANVVSYIRRSSVFVISLYFSFILTGYVINICKDIQ